MAKVVVVRIGEFTQFGIEAGQRTLRFKKKDYDFEVGNAIAFYRHVDGMDVNVRGLYEVTDIDYGNEGQYALVSFRKMRDYEDE